MSDLKIFCFRKIKCVVTENAKNLKMNDTYRSTKWKNGHFRYKLKGKNIQQLEFGLMSCEKQDQKEQEKE